MLTVDDVSPGLLAVVLGAERERILRVSQATVVVMPDGRREHRDTSASLARTVRRTLSEFVVDHVADDVAELIPVWGLGGALLASSYWAIPAPDVQQHREDLAALFGVELGDVERVEPSRRWARW